MASPMYAVKSNILRLKAPKIEFNILNAIFKPPPNISLINFRIANKPLSVLVKLSELDFTLFKTP